MIFTRRPSKVILRMHGGLGNQLFQLFFAELCIQRYGVKKLYVYHDDRYPHGFKASELIQRLTLVESIKMAPFVSRHRLIKLLEKLNINSGKLQIGNVLYLDGYFSTVASLENFSRDERDSVLNKLRQRLNGVENQCERDLYHIRLGDFYSNDDERLAELARRLSVLPMKSSVMTNDEHLLRNKQIEKLAYNKQITLVATAGMVDHEVLYKMAEFQTIETNGSTLAFWAALLNKKQLIINHDELTNVWNLLQ